MINLAKKLDLVPELISALEKEDKESIELIAQSCVEKGFHILKSKSPIIRLAVILTLAVRVKDKYDEAGIDEKVYYDTMSDIRLWCEDCGNKGLENSNWLKNHVSFELFRLGRLQFQFYECNGKTVLYKKLPFDSGEKVVYVHIPRGEKLEKEKCIESLKTADVFFKKHFSSYSYRYYFCESWLLYEGNRDFMAQSSNIVAFMSLFDIRYSVKIDKQAIERIYGKRQLFKRNYSEITDLQRRAKKYMLSGGRLGVGVGVIERTGEYK